MITYRLSAFFFLLSLSAFIYAQLQSGPMPGFTDMREAHIWVQTSERAMVQIKYTDTQNPAFTRLTNKVITAKEDAFTALLIADSVEPGRTYTYALLINGNEFPLEREMEFQTLPLWQHRADPPDVKFAAGSCAYINEARYDRPGEPYGGGYQVFEAIHEKNPDFMLWLGDNVYLREPDWNTRTGICHRYTHDRSIPEMQNLLSATHHYAVWDDHDFGPNNSDRSFWNKETTLEAFKLFWANPSYGVNGIKGITTKFEWADLDFFLLDNRFHRSVNERTTGERTILGEAQLEWLKDALAASHATFKFVVMGGQFLNDAGQYEMYSAYGYDKERQEIIDYIYAEHIQGVIFISGDRHHTELSYLPGNGKPDIYDATFSPLTSGAHTGAASEKNTLRMAGTLVQERNFGVFEVTGDANNRRLIIKAYDSKGKILWERTIKNP